MLFLILVFCPEELFFHYNQPQAKNFKKKAKKPTKQFLDLEDRISLYRIAQDCKCDNLPPQEQEDIPKARVQAMIMLLTDLITKLQTSDVVSE